jgi:anaerobic magnesium-protoporphyrin IX monomethyl ester cyclase
LEAKQGKTKTKPTAICRFCNVGPPIGMSKDDFVQGNYAWGREKLEIMATQVILIYPPIYYSGEKPVVLDVSYPPLGILYLASALEWKGVSVSVIDVGAMNQGLAETLSVIDCEKPAIVGISAMTPMLQGTVSVAKAVKERFRDDLKVCLGGSHVSADPWFTERVPYFDYAIRGEAEISFIQLVEQVLSGKPGEAIPPPGPVPQIDDVPWPARHLVQHAGYLKKASIIATRGCPYHCNYCSRPAVSNVVRCRAPRDVVAEMESLHKNCGGEYLFQDDSLTIRREHTVALCETMLQSRLKFRWAAYTRVDLVDDELLKLMARAGCNSLTFGIESGNERLRRDVIRKNFSNIRIRDVIHLCIKHGIEPDGFFMFSHPTETRADIEETTAFIMENDFNIVGVSIATPFPGSSLWEHAVAEGIIDMALIDDFALGRRGKGYAGYPVYVPKTLDLKWLYAQRKKVMRDFYLRPKYIRNRILKDIKDPTKLFQDVKEGINVFFRGSSSRSPYRKVLEREHKEGAEKWGDKDDIRCDVPIKNEVDMK